MGFSPRHRRRTNADRDAAAPARWMRQASRGLQKNGEVTMTTAIEQEPACAETAEPGARIIIDDEIRALIPPLTTDERTQLMENLQAEGCRDPLVVWKGHGVLLDGHNRRDICTELGIPFQVV